MSKIQIAMDEQKIIDMLYSRGASNFNELRYTLHKAAYILRELIQSLKNKGLVGMNIHRDKNNGGKLIKDYFLSVKCLNILRQDMDKNIPKAK